MIIDEKIETNNDGSLIPVDDTMDDSDDLIIEFNDLVDPIAPTIELNQRFYSDASHFYFRNQCRKEADLKLTDEDDVIPIQSRSGSDPSLSDIDIKIKWLGSGPPLKRLRNEMTKYFKTSRNDEIFQKSFQKTSKGFDCTQIFKRKRNPSDGS